MSKEEKKEEKKPEEKKPEEKKVDKQEKKAEEKPKKEAKEASPKEEAPEKKAKEEEKKEEKKPEPPQEVKLEKFYPERHLKNGEVFLKRFKGKPRLRKIVSKNNQAQLYYMDQKKWLQKTALPTPKKGPKKIHGLKWHLRNDWKKVDAKEIQPPA